MTSAHLSDDFSENRRESWLDVRNPSLHSSVNDSLSASVRFSIRMLSYLLALAAVLSPPMGQPPCDIY